MITAGKISINNVWYSPGTFHLLLKNEDEGSWKESMVQFLNAWFDTEDFIEVQTSGTTGKPKVTRLPKESMAQSARMTCRFFNLSEENTALLCLPADYIAGKMMLVRAIVCGFNLLAVKPSSNPFSEVDSIVDFAAITPYQFINSYQSIREKPIRKIIIGGSSVSLRLQKMMEDLDTDIYETYGMTETCSHVALRKLNGAAVSEYFETLPGIEIKQDSRNCLTINAPALISETLITNDVVELKDHNHFKWLGRFDHVINSGGIKIFPEQIEKKIEPFIDRRFFIGALPDERLNEKAILIIEGSHLSEVEELTLSKNLDLTLTKYEKPKQIYYMQEFDISSSGKILKSTILQKIKTLSDTSTNF